MLHVTTIFPRVKHDNASEWGKEGGVGNGELGREEGELGEVPPLLTSHRSDVVVSV